jgi:membrane protein
MVMLASTGVVILVSMLLSTGLSRFEDLIQRHAPAWLGPWTLTFADWVTSFLLMGALFALILKYVPDAVVRWRDALVGAAFTAVLFTAGQQLIGFYLGRIDAETVYGAAGSLAVALLWVYYSAMIVLLGAEFTEVWATRKGEPVTPQAGAVRVVRQVEAPLE